MSKSPHKAGFSLVEVVLSLGVIAFAFVGLLGLIPAGLNTLNSAIDATVESEILQHISTMARQSSFTALKLDQLDLNPGQDAQYSTRPMADYYFDDQGEEIKADLATQQKNYVYAAAVVSQVGTPVPASVTGSASASYAQVATVRVIITKRSDPSVMRAYSLYVANNGLGQ